MEKKPGDWLRTYFKLGDKIDLYALEQLRAEADRLDGVGMTEIEEVLQAAREKWPEAYEILLNRPEIRWYSGKYQPEGTREIGNYTIHACRPEIGWSFGISAPTLAALLEKIRGAK